jgi:hypothetical protein
VIFSDKFSITPTDAIVPLTMGAVHINPGLYEDGLITVLGQQLSGHVAAPWTWLIGTDAVALAVTWSGELFFWSQKHEAVYFLDVQRGQSTFVDRDIGYFFNEFLTHDSVRTQVLLEDEFRAIRVLNGELAYGKCYVREPWARHGGPASVANYGIGEINVYFSLVANEVQADMDRLRRG